MKRRIIFLLLAVSNLIFSQNLEEYNKIYHKTFLVTAQKDFDGAIKVTDSLYSISETPVFQTRSLMLSANLYFQKGNVDKAMEQALKAKNIIEPTDQYLMQSKIYGFLSSLYLDLNLYRQSKEYFTKCVEISDKIEDKNVANNMKGVIFLERGQAEIKFMHYTKSIGYLKKSQQYFKLVKDPQVFLLANAEQLLGQDYYFLQQYDQAFLHFNKALEIAKKIPDSYVHGFINNGLAKIYIDQKDPVNAKKHLTIAQEYADKTQFLALKKDVNTTFVKYYELTDNMKGLIEVQKKQEVVTEQLQKPIDQFLDKSLIHLKGENKIMTEKISVGKLIILGGSVCLLLTILYFFIRRKKHQADYENFQKIMIDLQLKISEQEKRDADSLLAPEINAENVEKLPKASDKVMIDATELKLLKKLEKFENSILFTRNPVSLSTLSTYCETNTRYLSHIINTHKKKDFNNYINELRINYIIKKLEHVPKYRKFKIAALSEEAGFSSANKFAHVFKKVTHISPSVFIQYLEKSKEEEESL